MASKADKYKKEKKGIRTISMGSIKIPLGEMNNKIIVDEAKKERDNSKCHKIWKNAIIR